MPDQIERNLLLFLDPCVEGGEWRYHFVAWRLAREKPFHKDISGNKGLRTVYCFDRRDLIGYLFLPLYLKLHGLPRCCKKVYYLHDGLLSAIFFSDRRGGYRAFATSNLPSPSSLRRKFISLLPLFIRAEKRYVITWNPAGGKNNISCEGVNMLNRLDFMFFSNPAGKLLLTTSDTLRLGKGLVVKSTTNPGYAKVMENEFATMLGIPEVPGRSPCLPRPGGRFTVGTRVFFHEEYITGRSLREILHSHSLRNDTNAVCGFLDLLDEWYENYMTAFNGKARSLEFCYKPLFDVFSQLYGSHHQAVIILRVAREAISKISESHEGIVPITTHNDLWPGNFVVKADDSLIALDWERATENRAPIFDYYWMILSTVLEHAVARSGVLDYSRAFRHFLRGGDDVTRHAKGKLTSFLLRNKIDKKQIQLFLLLFLMEWSVQGYQALHNLTAMDRLAFDELTDFAESYFV